MTMRLVMLVFLMVSLLVDGCTGGGASTPPTSPSPATLAGRTFLATGVDGHDLVPGKPLRFGFGDVRFGVGSACNDLFGSYAIVDCQLKIRKMGMTLKACEPSLMEQDTWVGTFIDGATVTLAGDTLTLVNGGVTMTLTVLKVADLDRPRTRPSPTTATAIPPQ